MEDQPTPQQESQRQADLAQERKPQLASEETEEEDGQSERNHYRKILKICVVLDAVELISLGTLGWFIGQIGDFYLLTSAGQSKAGRAQKKKMIVAIIGEFIPGVNILPLRTILWMWGNPASRLHQVVNSPIIQRSVILRAAYQSSKKAA